MDTLLKKNTYLPSTALRPYIDRYWTGEGMSSMYAEATFAIGTGAEMIFQLGEPMMIAGEDGITLRPPANAVYCIRRQVYKAFINHHHTFIAVRFKAGAIRHFSPLPAAALSDIFPDVAMIYGDVGKKLIEKLHINGTLDEQLASIEQFLISALHRNHSPHAMVDEAVRRLYYSREPLDIASLSAELGSSYRQFERLFADKTGITPKSFQQTARLHNALKYLLFNNIRDYLPVAFDFGFYDQSHFIRACRRFFGDKPTAIFSLGSSGEHFYLPSLKC
jgi:AraC-like DNA-binding protein